MAVFNNGYGMNYGQYGNYGMSMTQNNSGGGIIWVQGVEGAKAWQLNPNSNVLLMDSENENRFYIKTSDNVGICNLRYFKYEEISGDNKQSVDLSQYVTRDELQTMLNSILGGQNNEQSISTDKQTSSNKPRTITK